MEERPKKSSNALAVVTHAQKKRAKSQEETQEDTIESQEETRKNVDTSQKEDQENASRIRGGIIGMPNDNWPGKLGSAMESNDVEREFPFEDELFGEQRKTRARLT